MMQKDNENGRHGELKCEIFLCVYVSTFVVLGDGLLGAELDPCKATVKRVGRATHCFLNQDFPNQTVRHHCLSSRCSHLWPW